MGKDIDQKLQKLDAVKNVNGRMGTMVIASIASDRLTLQYKKVLGDIMTDENGFIINPEKSRLISYDETQFKWAKAYLTEGKINEASLNKNNGIIAVNKIYRNNELTKTTSLRLGDKVRIKTESGIREFTVLAIADSIPYSTDDTVMTTFITTEQLFREVSADDAYKEIDVQLTSGTQDRTAEQIKALAGRNIKVGDRRQMNQETNNAFITVTIFIYGFVTVIALISILNIMNTMNTSIAAKMKKFGVMRAVGMSGSQLSRMVITEAAAYCLTGCLFGTILGVSLRKAFSGFLQIAWKFPLLQVLSIIILCLLASLISIVKPLQQMKARGISDVINTL
jgi:ABC-type transport system, involved in lipoprotein release, permease component